MLNLVTDETYEKVYEGDAVFNLRKLSAEQVNSIEDQITVMGIGKGSDDKKLLFLGGTGRGLKVKYAVLSWKNVTIDGKSEAPCTDENKKKLPAKVQMWLEEDINKVNGLTGVDEETKKN